MDKKQYAELLKTDEWKSKRVTILKRDGFKCCKCGSKLSLHVHHKKYIKGKNPWQVPNSYLQTLCANCHTEVHKGKKISDFVKRHSKAKDGLTKNQRRINRLTSELSKKDYDLQLRYDKQRIIKKQ